MTIVVMAADGAAAACCGSTTAVALRGPLLASAAVLPAARGALDERRLVGTAASDLNTLAGVRGERWAPPCEHEGEKIKPPLLEDTAFGETVTYLGVEKPRFLGVENPQLPPRRASPLSLAAWRQRSRARPRHCFFCRLRGSGRGGCRLPPLGESLSPIALLLLVR
jgi:hypothetical protein